MFYVYKITNLSNGKLYIGKAENVEVRWQKHLSDTRTNRGYVLHNAIRKYGSDNFEVSIIEKCKTEIEAMEKEVFWIAEYKTNICKYGDKFGYNLTDGGDGITGHQHTNEAKQKMSEASKGIPKSENHKEQLSIARIGMKLTPEHILNITKAITGLNCNKFDIWKANVDCKYTQAELDRIVKLKAFL
jgi:group I intron endonuclease